MALLLAVLILASLLAIGLGIFDVVFGEIRITEELSDSFVALSAADQGIEQLLYNDLVADALPGCSGNGPCTYGPVNVDLGSQRCTRLSLRRVGGGQTTAESIGDYRCGSALSVKRRLVTSYEKAAAFGFSPDTAGTLESGLVAYWPLNETSGTRSDVKGSNHLADNNTVTSNPGRVDNAAQFTRANGEYLSIGDTADLSMGGPEISFTIAAWVYPDSTNGQGIITKATSGAGASAEYALWFVGGSAQIDLYVSDGATLTTVRSSPLTIGSWNFVTAWHDAALDQIAISVNNGASVIASHAVGSYDSSGGLEIGSWRPGTGWVWDGRIDEVGIWKRVLTVQERTDLWNNGNGNTCASPCQP